MSYRIRLTMETEREMKDENSRKMVSRKQSIISHKTDNSRRKKGNSQRT